MPYSVEGKLVVAISSRALFDFEEENRIFESAGEAPYIEMVQLKGASPLRTVLAHALPNAVGPIANAVALSLSYLLGGVIIVETIFNYPGIAKLMVDGVTQRDLPLVQACAMLFCAGYLILVTTADLCGIVANPRLRHR